jgi:putative transposase
VLQAERSSYHYKGRRGVQAELKQRIKEIAEARLRYGYRRIHVLLRREGWAVNQKRVRRLYRETGLQLRNKTPSRSNEIWAMDFVHDQLAMGTKIRILTIVDTFSRFSPAVEARFRFRGCDVVETLERIGREHGLPKAIRVDQGSEFVKRDLDL